MLRSAIVEAYRSREESFEFLHRVKFPVYPDFQSNTIFWSEVFRQGADGIIRDYFHRFLDAFEARYSDHPVVKDLRRRHDSCGTPTASREPSDGKDGRELSHSTRERFRADLGAAAATASCDFALTRWTAAELTALRDRLEAWQFRSANTDAVVGRAIDLLQALSESLRLLPVLTELGVSTIKIDYLKHIYWQTVKRLPSGNTLESMTIEAAGVAILEEKIGQDTPLTGLVRFALGVAGYCGADVMHTDLSSWLQTQPHQAADASDYLASMSRPAWLLVDCGDEPRQASGRVLTAPTGRDVRLTGILQTAHGVRRLEQPAMDGLEPALRRLLDQVRPERRLVVDLAVPHSLMGAGLEHLPVVRSANEEYEPLTASCQPRLRWSLRLHHQVHYGQPTTSASSAATWKRIPRMINDSVLADRDALRRWLQDSRNLDLPYLVGGPAANTDFDPVLMLLRSGKSFIIWFTRGADPAVARRLAKTAKQIPPASRRLSLPEKIPIADRESMTVIWDDPDGREGFTLPTFLPGFGG